MAEFKLYCFGESGNSYKAALMLQLCGLDWEPIKIEFFTGGTRQPDFKERLNEMGEAPVLEHNGKLLSQSGVILDYLASLTGKFGWNNDDERREIYRWILFDNHKFTSYISTLRYLITLMKQPENDVTKFLLGRVNNSMKVLEAHLAKHDFIACDRPTIADLSICGYLYFGDELPFEITPHVKAWSEKIKGLPGWKHPYDLMPRALV
ncbi:MAG TPA: glutathione S-transferase [Aestuariivirga sp.]